MSEIAGSASGVRPIVTRPPAPVQGTPETAHETAHESYSFACMRCGHGWEQSYDIQHHVDADGKPFVVYYADGVRVPSPLTRPTCENCGEHVVRIMRSGRVSTVAHVMHQPASSRVAPDQATAGPPIAVADDPDRAEHAKHAKDAEKHHWHLSDLLHPFQHHQK
ncbi:hypothetical protein [Streptomyces sp. UNOC14_S4]|uniref:hypothetical protein n=1 Tax=Streptomyces sp. UNOC14_S4 TaxID=2872340 RepID=UPI001E42AF24|nr:hypothetical protein [Streptomyces sp. UNOC14_S4]MCC3768915.1 hypothetical protein [Streptomyces sp. UNOC14_S4]